MYILCVFILYIYIYTPCVVYVLCVLLRLGGVLYITGYSLCSHNQCHVQYDVHSLTGISIIHTSRPPLFLRVPN